MTSRFRSSSRFEHPSRVEHAPIVYSILYFVLFLVARGYRGIVWAQEGRPIPPQVPDGPLEFDAAENVRFRVEVVTRGLSHPWALAFLPGGDILVTERAGRVRIIRKGVLDSGPHRYD